MRNLRVTHSTELRHYPGVRGFGSARVLNPRGLKNEPLNRTSLNRPSNLRTSGPFGTEPSYLPPRPHLRTPSHSAYRFEQLLVLEGLQQKPGGAGLDGTRGHRRVAVAGDEDRRDRSTLGNQVVVQLVARHARHSHIEDEAS